MPSFSISCLSRSEDELASASSWIGAPPKATLSERTDAAGGLSSAPTSSSWPSGWPPARRIVSPTSGVQNDSAELGPLHTAPRAAGVTREPSSRSPCGAISAYLFCSPPVTPFVFGFDESECPGTVIRSVNPGARRPDGKARGARKSGICKRRATPPAGMPRPGVMPRITVPGHEVS